VAKRPSGKSWREVTKQGATSHAWYLMEVRIYLLPYILIYSARPTPVYCADRRRCNERDAARRAGSSAELGELCAVCCAEDGAESTVPFVAQPGVGRRHGHVDDDATPLLALQSLFAITRPAQRTHRRRSGQPRQHLRSVYASR